MNTVYVETSGAKAVAGHVYLSAVFFKTPLLSHTPEFIDALRKSNEGRFKYVPEYYQLLNQIKDEIVSHTVKISVVDAEEGVRDQVRERLDNLVSWMCLKTETRTLQILTSDEFVTESYYFRTQKIPARLETRIARSISYLHTKYSMKLYDLKYPKYLWRNNLGFRSYHHNKQIVRYGLSPYHRRDLNQNIARWLFDKSVVHRCKELLPSAQYLLSEPSWWKRVYPSLKFNHCLSANELEQVKRVVDDYNKGKYSAKYGEFQDWAEHNAPTKKLDLQLLKDLGINLL